MIIDIVPNKRLPRGIGDTFSYNVPEEFESGILPGQLVEVDFRGKIISALVKTIRPEAHDSTLKSIIKPLTNKALVTPNQMRLALWIANHYFTSLATATKLFLPDLLKKQKDTKKEKAENNKQTLHLFPEFYQAENEAKKQLPPLNPSLSIGGEGEFMLWQNYTSKKKYLEQWDKILYGKAKLIVGTRSALFAPYHNLGMIILEDESNPLYKSEITPRYHSREVAEELARLHGAKLVINSPAPSLESYNGHPGGRRQIGSKDSIVPAISGLQSDNIKIVDLKKERELENYSSLADELQEDIKSRLEKKEKIFLFLNRRGHSGSALCKDCGHTFLCPECHLPLRYHNNSNLLVCHHCRYKQELPPFCPKCSSAEIKLVGKGTEKLEQEINKIFPKTSTYKIDSDTKIDEKKLGQANIIIGTEYAFSDNRLDWSKITLIAALNADSGLYRPDYRASERTYQLLIRLASLNHKSKVYIQTYNPDNHVIKSIEQRKPELFYEEELAIRKALGYPPYQDLIKLIYRNTNEKKTVGEAMHIYNRLRKHLIKEAATKYPIEVLKPFPAFERKERGKFKFHLILKIGLDAPEELYEKIRGLVPADWVFDRDPETLL